MVGGVPTVGPEEVVQAALTTVNAWLSGGFAVTMFSSTITTLAVHVLSSWVMC